MSTPKITTIVPVYNAGEYIKQCCNTILTQSLTEIEIIFVDDGSTDNSVELLEEIAKNETRITIIKQANQGAGIARNTGIKQAKGEYIHFLDADDFLEPDAYKKTYELAKKLDVDMLKAKSYAVDDVTNEYLPNERYQLSRLKLNQFNKAINPTSIENLEYILLTSVVPWNGIYKREFILQNEIWFNDLICVNDRSFFNNVIVNSSKVAFAKHHIVHHRVNVSTSLVGNRARHFECHFKSYKLIAEQSKKLDINLYALVLNNEISDVLSWYKKFKDNETLGEEITAKTKEFLLDLDYTFFLENLEVEMKKNYYFKCMELVSKQDKISFDIERFNDYPPQAKIDIILLELELKKVKQKLYSSYGKFNILHIVNVTIRYLMDNGIKETLRKITTKLKK